MEYKIKEFKTVPISQLDEGINVRDTQKEDEEKFEEMKTSVKYGAIFNPLLVMENSEDKYHVIAGHRRFKAIKDANIENVPILIIETPSENLRKVALAENVIRLNMDGDDIGATLKDIYENEGFTFEESLKYLDCLHTGKKRPIDLQKVPENFKELRKTIGMDSITQYRHLKNHVYLSSETKVSLRRSETKLSSQKAMLLTNEKIRKDPNMQIATANVIKDMTEKQASEFVKNVRDGNYSLDKAGKSFKVKGQPHQTINSFKEAPEVKKEYRSFYSDGIELASDLIDALTHQEKHVGKVSELSEEVIEKSRDWRLQSMKRLQETELSRMHNYLAFLTRVILDITPMLDQEIETKKDKEKMEGV
jgi:ParB-like chromosome segregation protein Spo0J